MIIHHKLSNVQCTDLSTTSSIEGYFHLSPFPTQKNNEKAQNIINFLNFHFLCKFKGIIPVTRLTAFLTNSSKCLYKKIYLMWFFLFVSQSDLIDFRFILNSTTISVLLFLCLVFD